MEGVGEVLSHNCKENMLTTWTSFVNQGIVQKNWVRKEIEDSWRRSLAMAIDPTVDMPPEVNFGDLEQRREAKRELLEISLPIMHKLHLFLRGTGFDVSLSDQDGVLLEHLPDTKIDWNFPLNGCNVNEGIVGTNSLALAIRLKRPIQVLAAEHYLKAFHLLACSSAPIFGHFGEILGVLTISGNFEKFHSHTLGMAVAAVNAIEGHLKANIANHYQTTIVNSISEGIIAVDEKARITKINAVAATLLQVDPETIMYSSINELLGVPNPLLRSLQFGDIVIDEDFQTKNGKAKTNYTITCRPIRNQQGKILGMVAIIKEVGALKRKVHQMARARARYDFDDLIGRHPSYLMTVELAKRAAKSSSNILLLGESGTGKEVFAQAIHNVSSRSKDPFIAINCAAIPRELIGSEMFGYSDGAFTGAKRGGNPGKFELAQGGTLFLDEIGEMPIELQPHLLRVLQEKVVTRIGGTQVIPIDVRVIAATNKDLYKEVEKGSFRKDLYYRLNVLNITMIPLRDRTDDIQPLAEFFMKKINNGLNKEKKVLHPETLKILQIYQWPGNIRELENVIEKACHIATGEILTIDCLPKELLVSQTYEIINALSPGELSVDEVIVKEIGKKLSKENIIQAVKHNQGNLTQTAKELGISRPTLYSKLKKYGIHVKYKKADSTEHHEVMLLTKESK
ncbi:sigma-54-dependent Fis family transcriptional regulator [Phosphitispora sp. TUW77]|uniref:sigma-54-dependent Fis family transcriptional regulator n=1 Tax=Phosphitispora sp. TUW77 TaxID=3152361 RepID=UPI003AB26CAE